MKFIFRQKPLVEEKVKDFLSFVRFFWILCFRKFWILRQIFIVKGYSLLVKNKKWTRTYVYRFLSPPFFLIVHPLISYLVLPLKVLLLFKIVTNLYNHLYDEVTIIISSRDLMDLWDTTNFLREIKNVSLYASFSTLLFGWYVHVFVLKKVLDT